MIRDLVFSNTRDYTTEGPEFKGATLEIFGLQGTGGIFFMRSHILVQSSANLI
jgi:hypothetical protein